MVMKIKGNIYVGEIKVARPISLLEHYTGGKADLTEDVGLFIHSDRKGENVGTHTKKWILWEV